MPGTTFLPEAGPVGTAAAMAVSVVVMLVIGINYHYMMNRHPGPGGAYAYAKNLFRRGQAFLCAWFLCLSYIALIPQNASALALISRYLLRNALQFGFHYQVAGYDVYFGEILLAEAVLILFGLPFIFRKRMVRHLQTLAAAAIVAGVLVVLCAGAAKAEPGDISPAFGMTGNGPVSGILTIVLLAPWAFVGFDTLSLVTEEFRFPAKKSFPIIAASILIGGFVYAALTWLAAAVVPAGYGDWQAYIAALGRHSGVDALPTFHAAQAVMGRLGVILLTAAALGAILGGIIGFYWAASRLLSAMARDHILSERFAGSSASILFIMGISLVAPFFGRTALGWIVDMSTVGAVVGFGYTSAAAYRTAKGEGNAKVQVTGALGAIVSAVFALVLLIPRLVPIGTLSSESYLVLALWSILGFVFYWRTLRANAQLDTGGSVTTGIVLFFLVFFSATMWFLQTVLETDDPRQIRATIVRSSVIQLVLILIGLVAIFFIYSELRKKQRILETEKIQAEEHSKAKSTFLFNMSHDIRTPMNAIIGYTTLAQKETGVPPQVEEYLTKINVSSQHLLTLINDVLEMSRIESGKMELEPVEMDPRDTLNEARDLFSTQMREKQIDFTVDTAQVRDSRVRCDKNRLDRVLLNLLSNAYKFTPEGGAVSVRLYEIDDGAGFGVYELQVKDSGIGMSEEFARKIFQAFERERTSTVSGIQGTGLGMAITKSIVDLMGGSIEVVTAPGQGTEFIVRLRLEQLADAAPDNGAAQEKATMDFSAMRLLLVEDNEINREIATLLLEEAGFALDTAVNGKEAVDAVAAAEPGTYDAVLMDIQMPVMNGYEAARAIRALDDPARAGIPIIAMTANAFAEDVQNARDAGMNGHIAKPIDLSKMLGTLTEVLTKHQGGAT